MSKLRSGLILGAASFLLIGGGYAAASIPGGDGVIHGCYKTSDGKTRIIDSGATCASGETPINWNQEGPKGDTGPAGPQGEQGEAGADGGVTGYEIKESAWTPVGAGQGTALIVNATCSEGKKPTGGGYITGGYPQLIVQKSLPTSEGWEVRVINSDNPSSPTFVQVFTICANVAS